MIHHLYDALHIDSGGYNHHDVYKHCYHRYIHTTCSIIKRYVRGYNSQSPHSQLHLARWQESSQLLCDLSPLVLDPLFTVQELYLTLKARVLMGFIQSIEDLGSRRDCVVVVVVVVPLVCGDETWKLANSLTDKDTLLGFSLQPDLFSVCDPI